MRTTTTYKGPGFSYQSNSAVALIIFVAIYVVWLAFCVYAFGCIMNHFDVWPFSHINGG